MALRVLLADESSTIKKVISLALQDFAVEVKVVHSGVDVVEVAKQFGPDIIFADVLLQKKNGYEVCGDIKNDSALSQIPVVLMWSSFMELDQAAFVKSKANAKLEKPFEVDDLRKLVNTLATKTRAQTASSFLKFPSTLTDPMKNEAREKQTKTLSEDTFSRLGIPAAPAGIRNPANLNAPAALAPPAAPTQGQKPQGPPLVPKSTGAPPSPANWNMDSFDDIQVFSEDDVDDPVKSLNQSNEAFSELRLTPPSSMVDSSETWEQKDLSYFKIDPSDEAEDFALIDLGRADVDDKTVVIKNSPTRPEVAQAKPVRNLAPNSPPRAPKFDSEGYQTFDYSDGEPALELDEQSPKLPPDFHEPHPDPEAAGEWNFKLPEHQVSPIQPGDVVELPPEYADELENESENEPDTFVAQKPQAKPQTTPQVTAQTTAQTKSQNLSPMDSLSIEKIVREQTRELVEKMIKRIVPQMAKELIQNELDRLLGEENS